MATGAYTQSTPPDGMRSNQVGIWFTNECNLRCTYCYIHEKSKETIPVEKAVELFSAHLTEPGEPVGFLFMGAEPLTHFEEIQQIVEAICARKWARKFYFSAATNGTLLTEEMKRWLTAHREIISLGLSYDGEDADQDLNRSQSSGRVDKQFFLTTWPRQRWKMTISRRTAPSIDRGIIALHEMGATFDATPAYEATPWSEEEIAQYQLAMYRLADYYIAHPDVKPCNLLYVLPEAIDAPEAKRQPTSCGAGVNLCFYDMQGEVYPCHMLSTLVLPRERTVQGQYFAGDADFEDPRCHRCAIKMECPTCKGANQVYRGDLRLRDPAQCKLYQADVRAAMHMWIGKLRGRDGYTAQEREIIAIIQGLQKAFDNGKIGMEPKEN